MLWNSKNLNKVLRVSLKTENEALFIFLTICCLLFITKNIQVVSEINTYLYKNILWHISDSIVIAFDVTEKLLQD